MSAVAQLLPPNGIPRFYRGGAAIAALRGFAAGAERTPEEWIASATTAWGEDTLGLSALADGTLLRDALEADPQAWLGAAHTARFGADAALLVKLLDTGERLPVHVHPDDTFAAAHLGLRFGKTEAWIVVDAAPCAQVHLGFREHISAETLAGWVAAQDRDALLGALVALDVRAGDALFVPAGVPHAIGEGVLIVELQQPTDLSVMLEWEGFGIDGEQEATLGLGWDVALRCVDRDPRDPRVLRGPRASGVVAELLDPSTADVFRAQLIAPGGGTASIGRGFAVIVVLSGSGLLAGLEVVGGDALVVPHAAGDVAAEGELVAVACRPPEVGS